jgi:hypothetical protein
VTRVTWGEEAVPALGSHPHREFFFPFTSRGLSGGAWRDGEEEKTLKGSMMFFYSIWVRREGRRGRCFGGPLIVISEVSE